MDSTSKGLVRAAAANFAVVAGTWLVAFALVQAARPAADYWFVTPVAILLAGSAGIIVALRLHTSVALFVILAAEAWIASTLAAHAIWGIRSVQGGPTHLTIGAAAMLGVVLGAIGVAALERSGKQGGRHSTAEV